MIPQSTEAVAEPIAGGKGGYRVTLEDGRTCTTGGQSREGAIEAARGYFENVDHPRPTPAVRKALALAEQRGEDVCGRCGGYGGSKHWPGFTCHECNGRRTVPKTSSERN